MTTIKLNCDVEKPENCMECPFCCRYPFLDVYGWFTGYYEFSCSLTDDVLGSSYDWIVDVSDTCPIISIEKSS